jgi:hypothetical protein
MAHPQLNRFMKQIVDALIFSDYERRVKAIDAIIMKNCELQGRTEMAFAHMGKVYHYSDRPRRYRSYPMLDPSLHDEMEQWLYDETMVERDRVYLKQGLFPLLEDCMSHQDFRDALPECLVTLIPDYAGLPRTREPGYTIMNKPAALKRYAKMLPKIEAYTISKMFG